MRLKTRYLLHLNKHNALKTKFAKLIALYSVFATLLAYYKSGEENRRVTRIGKLI
jgi:hypothetical protein